MAMLRQEFIDEIDLTRTLREEFMAVFTEEADIMNSLREAEEELGQLSGTADDADKMQEILDRMNKLQNKADAKNVNALDSRVSKIMDLMGFEPEEGDYLVSAFSGGWKMRIGLGKVLLQDPNILLLDESTLFEESDLFIEKGDRIAIIGPNGSGKSTLLRILMGKEEPDEGAAEFIGSNVYPAYFEQNQADVLDLDKTVVDTVQAASNGQSYNELRALLGQFLFKGDAVEKKVENLSGGEKARLSLCCMMLKESNLLILDEPTNHLVRIVFISLFPA